MIPESRFPTVQPNAIIDPKPINNPPIKEFLTSWTLGIWILKFSEKTAAAKEPNTKPKINRPLFVQKTFLTTVIQPL